MRIFLDDTPVLALKIIKRGVGMYLRPPCYGYALNCHLVYLAIPGTRLLCMKKKICLFYLYATAKSEIQICLNKHETGLVLPFDVVRGPVQGFVFLYFTHFRAWKAKACWHMR